MGTRSSQQDQDGFAWQTVGLKLGAAGLDLRLPSDPGTLKKLHNARFLDERTLIRRNGHDATLVQDSSAFTGAPDPIGWVYGHGQQLAAGAGIQDTTHHPIARRGAGTFTFGNSELAWTGDRLLVLRDDGAPGIGSSKHWNRDGSLPDATPEYGVPCYLPVQVDSLPPDTLSGSYAETCLTSTLRVFLADDASGNLYAWVVDRTTGSVLDKTLLGNGTIRDPRVVNSGDTPYAVWRSGANLCASYWTGAAWTTPDVVSTTCTLHEVAPVDGGFHLLWRDSSASDMLIGRFEGRFATNVPYLFGTAITPHGAGGTTGAVAMGVAADGTFAIAWQATSDHHLFVTLYTAAAASYVQVPLDTAGPYTSGLSVCSRGLRSEYNTYPFVVHAGNDSYVVLSEVYGDGVATGITLGQGKRYRSVLASRSFAVGDEVFCWLKAKNASTAYLVAGVLNPIVCGFADREEAISGAVNDGVLGLPLVTVDPLNAASGRTWCRLYTIGQAYARAGNARVGDLEFLPPLSAVHYGRSVSLAGSAVRNWDGFELGDTGFQDYPTTEASPVQSTGGSLTLLGVYEVRAYAVRYNKQGERFQSAALTQTATLTGSNDKLTWTINTLPDTNHDDVRIEVYRTEAGGSTFYLEGSVANTLSADTVTFDSTMDDATLRDQPADPFQTGTGNVSEIENWGPVGCAYLVVAGDRMWAAGGQVPSGFAQFSKLKEDGFGVGFDDIAEMQEIDTQGGAITSIASFGDALVFFQRDNVYVLANAGPDNDGVGSFGTPQLQIADGATTHQGTALTHIGIVYWGVDGPRLLTQGFQAQQISLPVRPLASTLTPSGVRVDLARQEVVWYTADGDGLLWNYRSGNRWAQWKGLEIAGCSPSALMTTDGRLLVENFSPTAGDGGVPFAFTGATGEIRVDDTWGARMKVRSIGVEGVFQGDHNLRFRVFYNGSPLWTDEWVWEPTVGTWLESGESLGSKVPVEIDAMDTTDTSGAYATHKRPVREQCRHFSVEWSDVSAFAPTFVPFELTLEMASLGGMGRVPTGTFGG